MDRSMAGATAAELTKDVVRPVHLVTAYFPAGTVRLTDAAADVSYGGNVWLSTGCLNVGDVEETQEIVIYRTQVTLSGVDQSAVAAILQDDFLNRPCTVDLAFLNSSLSAVVGAPLTIISGTLDQPLISTDPDAGVCTVTVDVISKLIAMEQRRGRYTNDAIQQQFFPGDRGFEHCTEKPYTVNWGNKGRSPYRNRGG